MEIIRRPRTRAGARIATKVVSSKSDVRILHLDLNGMP